MSDKWWEKYEWGRIIDSQRRHAALPGDRARLLCTACGIIKRPYTMWDAESTLPRCKTCERVIAATAKRYEGKAIEAAKAKGGT